MELLPLVCLCLVTWSGSMSADVTDRDLRDRSKENITGAAPKPCVTTLDHQKYWALLQCEVNGASPKPTVEWKDSAGNILPAVETKAAETNGLFFITLQTNVAKTDNFRCVATQKEISHQVYAEISVYINVVVKEGSDVILPCSINENLELKLFVWRKDGQKEAFLYDAGKHYNNGCPGQDQQFKGRVSHFGDNLRDGNASIIIRKTTKDDSGDYTCDFPRLQPRQTFHVKLVVGAAPKPCITTLGYTKHRALLQCEVNGAYLKPTVEWKDSAGNILHAVQTKVTETNGLFFITLQTNVTKTDNFSCVATQKQISHQVYTETFLHIDGSVVVKEGSDVILPSSISINMKSELFVWKKDTQKNVFLYDAGDHYNNGRSGQDQQFEGRVSHFEDELRYGNASIIIRNTKLDDNGFYTCDFPHLQPRQTFHIKLHVVGSSAGWIIAVAVLITLLVVGVVLVPVWCWRHNRKNKRNKGQDPNPETGVPLRNNNHSERTHDP